MIIDTVSIVICIALLALSFATPLVNPFFRKLKSKENGTDSAEASVLPKLSVIITAQGNPDGLRTTLKLILEQEYGQEFEVVVVMNQGDIMAEEVVKTYSGDGRIYTTFVPPRSLFMSKEKLAVTLGVKAAHNEWIVLLPAGCEPQSGKWLSFMARNCSNDKDIVLGYSNYDAEAPRYYRFERLRTALYLMRKAQHGTAYRSDGVNLAFRKSLFITEDGYRGNLQFLHGEYDFIVNKYARRGNTAVETSSESHVREPIPTKKTWRNKKLACIHLRKSLLRSFPMRCLHGIDTFSMHMNYIAILAALICSAGVSDWLVLSVAILSLAITLAVRTFLARKAVHMFGEDIPTWRLVPYEFSVAWRGIADTIKYKKADKRDFTTHKI